MTSSPGNSPRWPEVFLTVALVASVIATWMQVRKAQHLGEELITIRAQMDQLQENLLRSDAGARFYEAVAGRSRLISPVLLEGNGLDASRFRVDLASLDRPALLYSIDPACDACIKTLPFIRSIHRARPCGVRVFGVGVNNLKDIHQQFADSEHIEFPVLTSAGGEAWSLLPTAMTPATVVIGPGGHVLGAWVGALSPKQERDITDALSNSCAP